MVGPGTGGSENRIELVGRGLGAETVEQVAPFGPGRSWVCAQAHHDPRSHWARPRHGVLEVRSAGTGVILRFRRCRGLSIDRKSTRLNSSHVAISYAVFCLIKKNSYGRLYGVRLSASSHHANGRTQVF